MNIELHSTSCPICKTSGNAQEIFAANFSVDAFNPEIFSARRLPDRIHYRMVRCLGCGLVRSDPVADAAAIAALYRQSSFDYGEEVANLQATYGRYLARLSQFGVKKSSLLEIGCGNGFFLEQAIDQGYQSVRGVEPSIQAAAQAKPPVRPHIVCDIMRPGLFAPEQFDVICMFQVFDHIAEPAALLESCWQVLRPGGLALCLNHNIGALSAQILKEHSPIIDIEHTYLYTPRTISRLWAACGFSILHCGPVLNTYTLHYLARLLPLPTPVKRGLLAMLRKTSVGRIRLSLPLGNLWLVARKPAQE